MKTSSAIIIAGIIVFVGIIIYTLSNRYYTHSGFIIDKFTGDAYRIMDKIKQQNEENAWSSEDFK